jgi:hypothetical protein
MDYDTFTHVQGTARLPEDDMTDWIAESITKCTGVTDSADIAHISDLMADQCQSFSGLSPERFYQIANEASELVLHLKTPEGQAAWAACKARYGVEDWAPLDRNAPKLHETLKPRLCHDPRRISRDPNKSGAVAGCVGPRAADCGQGKRAPMGKRNTGNQRPHHNPDGTARFR